MRAYLSKAAGPSQRQLKVGEEVRHVLSDILTKSDFHDEILGKTSVSVSEVRMSPDLRHARAYILPLGGENVRAVVEALNELAPKLRHSMSKRLTFKFLPQLRFVEDSAFFEAAKLNDIFHSPHVQQDLHNARHSSKK